jgi:hypothetical protein
LPSREASSRNLELARARWHAPRPWRSIQETRVIKRLVFQWFGYRGPEKWSGRAVARRLGVTHTYIEKLVREVRADAGEMLSLRAAYGEADFGDLSCAQEHTKRMKERGELRTPRLWKWVEFKIGDQVVRGVVPTKAAERTKAEHMPAAFRGNEQIAPGWANNSVPLFPRPVRLPRRRWRPGMPFR